MNRTDDQLIADARSGNLDALEQLLERHGSTVCAALSIAPQWQSVLDADDVMQITYLEACLAIQQFKPAGPGSFVAWLRQIAQNNLRDAVKELERAKRPPPGKRVKAAGDDSYADLMEQFGYTTTTPSRAAASAEAKTLLETAIARLPPDYERVVRECDLNGTPPAVVAAAMGRSVGAIYLLRMRAGERLRESLGSSTQFFTQSG